MSEYEVEYDNLEDQYENEIMEKCKGYTLKLTHPMIKENTEYQIIGFRERNGKYGEFFILYCYLPQLNKYQRVFSNSKLTGIIYDHMPAWNGYEMGENNIRVWMRKNRLMKFYPGELGNYEGKEFRRVIFEME